MLRVIVAALIVGGVAGFAADLREEVVRCSKITDPTLRLAAYDEMAKTVANQPEEGEAPAPAEAPEGNPAAEGDTGLWELRTEVSPMDDKKSFYLKLPANEQVSTDVHTYRPFLFIRYAERRLSAFISYDEFLGTEQVQVTVRFGKEQPVTGAWPTSTSGEAVFYPGDDARDFARLLAKYDQLVVRLTPYGETPRTVTFDLRGLREAIKPLAVAMRENR